MASSVPTASNRMCFLRCERGTPRAPDAPAKSLRGALEKLKIVEAAYGTRSLGADKAYGSGAFLAWLQAQGRSPQAFGVTPSIWGQVLYFASAQVALREWRGLYV